jgi:hypothetical protein
MISLTKSQNQSGARKPLMTGRIGSMYDMTCVGHRVSDGAFPPSGNLYNREEWQWLTSGFGFGQTHNMFFSAYWWSSTDGTWLCKNSSGPSFAHETSLPTSAQTWSGITQMQANIAYNIHGASPDTLMIRNNKLQDPGREVNRRSYGLDVSTGWMIQGGEKGRLQTGLVCNSTICIVYCTYMV